VEQKTAADLSEQKKYSSEIQRLKKKLQKKHCRMEK